MNPVMKNIRVPLSKENAFHKFVYELNEWWPKEYTWSGDKLEEITIEPKENGLCSETGPYHFRCDWGRVTKFEVNKEIGLKWQISPQRVPEPDPAKASDISIRFESKNGSGTELTLQHTNFENHGKGGEDYQKAMNTPQGWEYILNKYLDYCKAVQ